jgi:tRNA modification GTPase
MKKRLQETIVAIATPIGEGAISVIRVSGDLAITKVARQFEGKNNLATTKSHTAHFGRIVNSNKEIVDEVVCTIFRSPKSFTGENMVEIGCHGGIHVTRRVLECLLETEMRPAEPGEFTQRAFLNGKIDLSQAEAIADLIQAQSDKAQRTSLNQLQGVLSKQIHVVREELVHALGLLELELDFTEEGIELIDKQKVEELFKHGISDLAKLLSTYKYGRVWKEGVRVALVGAPNAGKSSLLNALLKDDRAIVTDIPGTTRDYIEENMIIDGVLFRLIDTAGLRKTEDQIEKEGVRRTWNVMDKADVVVLVHDSTKLLSDEEKELLESEHTANEDKLVIFANNKIDLKTEQHPQKFVAKTGIFLETSAVNNAGIESLKNALVTNILAKAQVENKESVTITNERHYSALLRAKESLSSSLESLQSGESGEFIALNLRTAIDSIGEIVGVVTTEDILNGIFSKFCIGK